MKAFKKLTAFLLTFVMLLGLIPVLGPPSFPVKATASDGPVYIEADYSITVLDEKKKTCMITSYHGTSGDIGIPSVINGYTVTEIGDSAFYGCEDLFWISIPDSVELIGTRALENCTSLRAITIPDSVTAIYWSAFENCTSLQWITIGKAVEKIGFDAFLNTAYYNNPSNWENGVLYIGKYLIGTVKNLSGYCSIKAGTELIGDFAFTGCKYLTDIKLPDSLISIGYEAFSACTGLFSVTFPKSVKVIGDRAFLGCIGLSSVTIGNAVEAIGSYAFEGTAYYNNPRNWVNGGLYNGKYLLKVKNLYGSYAVKDGTELISGKAFSECTDLIYVTLPDTCLYIGDKAFEMSEEDGYFVGTSLETVDLGNSVKTIGDRAFYSCSALTSITIPDSVISIGDCAFMMTDYDGYPLEEGLKTVSLGNSVETIGYGAFYGCAFTSITIPDSVKTIGYGAFHACPNLTSVKIGKAVKDTVSPMFYDCPDLTSITVDKANPYYSDLDGVLFNKAKTELLQYPKGNKRSSYKIPDSCQIIGKSAFDTTGFIWSISESALKAVIFGNSVEIIGDAAFKGCIGLISVTLPDSVKTIGNDAFSMAGLYDEYNSNNLRTVIFGNSVETIGRGAFKYCDRLTSVTLPTSVISIGDSAFGGETSLERIRIPTSVESIGTEAFSGANNLTIYGVRDSYAEFFALNEGIPFAETDPIISFKTSDGTGGPRDEAVPYYTVFTIPYVIPEKEGVEFLGWTNVKNSKEVKFGLGDSFTVTEDITLYAVWGEKRYTLSYDLNYGEGFFEPVTAYKGTVLQISSAKPTRVQGTFLGWSTQKGSKTVVYQPSDKLTLTEDTTLYAVWEMKTYLVIYDANGGEGAPESEFFEYGTPTPLTEVKPSKEGLYFLGWSKDKRATVPTYLPGSLYTSKGIVTLYAIYGDTPLYEDGDIDGDGKVTLNDAMLIIGDVAKKAPLSEENKLRSDIDSDGKITLNDAMYIISYVAKKSDTVKPVK